MKIRIGFDLTYECAQPTPMVLMLNVHSSRAKDLLIADDLRISPEVPSTQFVDGFGNICTRLVAPKGETRFSADGLVYDTGELDAVAPDAQEVEIAALPDEVLPFLNGSRYCETDRLMNVAWSLFSGTPRGWARVQAICDFVHSHIEFGYRHAHAMKSAHNVLDERKGVCRDFAHLAVTLCRCMGIPARYCTGYLGDIGVPLEPEPMDWSAWFEVYLDGKWYTFDARHNVPRIGRIVMARGRDATDVAISTTYGANILKGFKVVTVEAEARDESAMLAKLTPAAFRRWYGTDLALQRPQNLAG